MTFCIAGKHQRQGTVSCYITCSSKAVLQCKNSKHQSSTGTVKFQYAGNDTKGSHNCSTGNARSTDSEYSKEQAEQNQNLQKQIHEITQDIKEVKKTTVVRQETLTEQQKEVVREVIRQAPETVKEKDVSTLIRRQVQREVETQVDASLGQMTNRVYRRIEEKLRTERGRRGLL